MAKGKRIERVVESAIFGMRWVMAPVYLALMAVLLLLAYRFFLELISAVGRVPGMGIDDLVILILTLIDLTLAANLLVIVVMSGYENFVSRLEVEGHEDRPQWLGHVDFSALKLKLIASIVAISGIHLLKTFLAIHETPREEVLLQLLVHLGFCITGVLLAWMDRLSDGGR
ncbi:TIGR00645 family protein [Sabulicella rubraurantiaca]|uniref:TIGR00645 family protein n=1 Tax=Sabulicella rubraurantiaca TaxID=2811429 RepID=UPI001A9655ED|nr:TIGR00645 family protein [Sabulicella rubraurantiaca]